MLGRSVRPGDRRLGGVPMGGLRLHGFLLLLAGALLAAPSLAQTTGSIEGEVVDALTRRPVADAVVIVQGSSLQAEQTALTDGAGHFEIAFLAAGAYSLIVQREGYQPLTGESLLAVAPGQTIVA